MLTTASIQRRQSGTLRLANSVTVSEPKPRVLPAHPPEALQEVRRQITEVMQDGIYGYARMLEKILGQDFQQEVSDTRLDRLPSGFTISQAREHYRENMACLLDLLDYGARKLRVGECRVCIVWTDDNDEFWYAMLHCQNLRRELYIFQADPGLILHKDCEFLVRK